MSSIEEIKHNLATQDNRITGDPQFIVQRLRKYLAPDGYGDGAIWIDEDDEEVDSEKVDVLARLGDDDIKRLGYRRFEVHHIWEFVTACFTEKGCQDYLKRNGHNLGETRIYAESGYRNEEWIYMRDFIANHSENSIASSDVGDPWRCSLCHHRNTGPTGTAGESPRA